MKLYYAPGVCSLSPHIVLRETGTPFTLVKTDLRTKTTEDASDFRKVNPNGYVPVLELDDGTILTEGPAIVQYIADKANAQELAPPNGSPARYKLQSWLNFVSTELHKSFSWLFNAKMPEEGKAVVRERLMERLKFLNTHLSGNDYLMGPKFTIADAYAFTVLTWTRSQKIDLGPLPQVRAYMDRVSARPAVQEAMRAEGLAK